MVEALSLEKIIEHEATQKAAALAVKAAPAAEPDVFGGIFKDLKIDEKFINSLFKGVNQVLDKWRELQMNAINAQQQHQQQQQQPQQQQPQQMQITGQQLYPVILQAIGKVREQLGDVKLSELEATMRENPEVAIFAINRGIKG